MKENNYKLDDDASRSNILVYDIGERVALTPRVVKCDDRSGYKTAGEMMNKEKAKSEFHQAKMRRVKSIITNKPEILNQLQEAIKYCIDNGQELVDMYQLESCKHLSHNNDENDKYKKDMMYVCWYYGYDLTHSAGKKAFYFRLFEVGTKEEQLADLIRDIAQEVYDDNN